MVENTQEANLLPIETALASCKDGLPGRDEEVDRLLLTLEAFECWEPYFRLIHKKIKIAARRSINDYIRLARVYYRSLENLRKAGDVCFQMVRDLNVPFVLLRDEIIPQILYEEDFKSEASLLEAMLPALDERSDTISCLERLCLIYEKKKYDEQRLNNCYEKLVSLDPQNLKALRYFKVVYTQNQDWGRVVRVLRDLYENSRHVNDRYRIAQELATVYLYQLDEPRAAIEVIETLCKNSSLDTTTIHYEAFYRLEDWQGCMRVLELYLEKLEAPFDKAIILYKIGELETMLGRVSHAKERYQQSLRFAPHLLEALENLIEIFVEQRDWAGVLNSLEHLKNVVHKEQLKERVDEAIGRLKDGLRKKRS
ncbi:MAG: tetratricopeptide repeat protein [Oligoflexus sp.]